MVEIDLNQEGEFARVDQLSNQNDNQASKTTTKSVDLKLVNELRELVRKEFALNKDAYSSEHYEEILNQDSPFTCWRYLLHNSLNLQEAIEMVKKSLAWRKANQIDQLNVRDLIKEFWLYGPIHFTGKTKNGDDLVYVVGRDYRKADSCIRSHVFRYMSYLLFDWDRKEDKTMRKFSIVFDVTDTGYRNIDLDFMSWLIEVCDYVPARIEQIYVVGINFIIRPIVRLIISWLPYRFSSITHCGTIEDLVEANAELDQFPNECGGSRDDSYRLAPEAAPWASECVEFQEPRTIKALEYCLMGNVPEDKKERLRLLQLDFENNSLKK